MLKKVIFFSLLLLSMLNAASVKLNKSTYTTNENITVTFTDMEAKNQDWIGIYPKNKSNDFKYCVAWQWTNDVTNGQLTFDENLPSGQYEARAFYNNSGTLEAKKAFTIANSKPAKVTTNKSSYAPKESITVKFSNMAAKNRDWIGIYPKNKSNDFKYCVAWQWTNDVTNGQLTFDENLPSGKYEVRAFYNNSGTLEAKNTFTITGASPKVTTTKSTYEANEDIKVSFSNMKAKNQDWIGIYPKDKSNHFKNCVAWKWTDDVSNGKLTFTKNLPIGEYEVRAFYNNSVTLEAQHTFKITANVANKIVYETAEDGVYNPYWIRHAGQYNPKILNIGGQGSKHSLQVRSDWQDETNKAFYSLNLQSPSKRFRSLELDVKTGISSHVGYFGLIVETTQGTRWITWSSWMNHLRDGHNDLSGNAVPLNPIKKVYGDLVILMYPGPTDFFLLPRENNQRFEHYKIDIEKTIKRLEPNNKLIRIKRFITTGVDLDNLTLLAD